MKNNMKEINLNEMEKTAGGNYGFDAWRAWETLVIKITNAAFTHNRKACCPECGTKLEWLPQQKADDFVCRAAYEKGLLKCISCSKETKPDKWVINSFN